MSTATVFGMGAALLIGLGSYGLLIHPHPLRKILALNVIGSGIFMLFGAIAYRGAAAGLAADPVPQALLITGIVVAFSASALAVALLLRLFEVSRNVSLKSDEPAANSGSEKKSS
jgi:multicomponent Na+:H+ antiporter subunit C